MSITSPSPPPTYTPHRSVAPIRYGSGLSPLSPATVRGPTSFRSAAVLSSAEVEALVISNASPGRRSPRRPVYGRVSAIRGATSSPVRLGRRRRGAEDGLVSPSVVGATVFRGIDALIETSQAQDAALADMQSKFESWRAEASTLQTQSLLLTSAHRELNSLTEGVYKADLAAGLTSEAAAAAQQQAALERALRQTESALEDERRRTADLERDINALHEVNRELGDELRDAEAQVQSRDRLLASAREEAEAQQDTTGRLLERMQGMKDRLSRATEAQLRQQEEFQGVLSTLADRDAQVLELERRARRAELRVESLERDLANAAGIDRRLAATEHIVERDDATMGVLRGDLKAARIRIAELEQAAADAAVTQRLALAAGDAVALPAPSEDAAALARSRDYYRDKAHREARRVAELQKALTVLEARVSAVFATTTSQGV